MAETKRKSKVSITERLSSAVRLFSLIICCNVSFKEEMTPKIELMTIYGKSRDPQRLLKLVINLGVSTHFYIENKEQDCKKHHNAIVPNFKW